MTTLRCSRCGREERLAELGDATRIYVDAGDGKDREEPSVPVMRAWSSFDGADVCPDCQSAQERDEMSQRILAAIQLAVARATADGTDPSPR